MPPIVAAVRRSLPKRPSYSDRDLLSATLRQDFCSFVQKVFETVSPEAVFSQNWSVEAVCHSLDKIVRGETTRLIINIPPRHLKSICASVALPAFILGHDPTKRVICVSYSDDLAKKFSNDFRAVVRSYWYQRLFPGMRIDNAKDKETEVQTTKRGYRLATSVGGTLTGRGGDSIIIDDPIKPQDAHSEPTRQKTIDWYENTLLSRLDDKRTGAIVLVMQRLHMDDLAGHLLEKGGFEHLCLPAIADRGEAIQLGHGRVHHRHEGEVLDATREPLAVLEDLRKGMTPLTFSAQYLQAPIPVAGNLIKREWIKLIKGVMPWQPGEYYVISLDTAMKANERADYSVATVWQVQDGGSKLYLVDLVRGRFEFPDLVKVTATLCRKWTRRYTSTHLIIEDKGSGTSLIQALKQQGIYGFPNPAGNGGDKIMRLEAQTAQFAGGVVHFREDVPWLDELLNELLAFPAVRHDDQVDSISQALSFVTWVENNRVRITHHCRY